MPTSANAQIFIATSVYCLARLSMLASSACLIR